MHLPVDALQVVQLFPLRPEVVATRLREEPPEVARVVERVALREERDVEDRGGAEDEEREVERRRSHVPPLEQVEGYG